MFNVGDRVVICVDSVFYGRGEANPDNSVVGTVLRFEGNTVLDNWLIVEWDNGRRNSYTVRDLQLAEERKEQEEAPVKKESLTTFINKATKSLSGLDASSNGYFAFVYRDTKQGPLQTTQAITGACHASALSFGKGHVTEAIVSRINRQDNTQYNQLPPELCIEYYDWLFNRSGWKDAFRSKSAKWAWSRKVAVMRTQAPANLVQAALIASRNTWEYPNIIRDWKKFKDAGINENLAFCLAHVVYIRSDGDIISSNKTDPHNALSGSKLTVKGVEGFLKCKPVFSQETYIKGGNTSGATKAFEGNQAGRVELFYQKVRDLIQNAGSEGVDNTNPFKVAKAKRSVPTLAFDKFVAAINKEYEGVV